MKAARTTIIRRLWAFVLLLAFAGQSLAQQSYVPMASGSPLGGAAKELSATTTTECHGAHDQAVLIQAQVDDPLKPGDPSGTSTSMSCCDGDCQMSMCNATLAMVNSIKINGVLALNHSRFSYVEAAHITPTSSLFRPPILG